MVHEVTMPMHLYQIRTKIAQNNALWYSGRHLRYLYQKYVNPDWRTLEMLENTEHSLHNQVRREHPENSPPVLKVERLGENELIINYVSPRRMGGLAVGIVRGLAAYYDEADKIDVMPTTSEDGEHVQIHVRRK